MTVRYVYTYIDSVTNIPGESVIQQIASPMGFGATSGDLLFFGNNICIPLSLYFLRILPLNFTVLEFWLPDFVLTGVTGKVNCGAGFGVGTVDVITPETPYSLLNCAVNTLNAGQRPPFDP